MFTPPHLSAVSTLRTSSARLQSPLLMATRMLVSASRSATLVRTCCFPRHLTPANGFASQKAKMRQTSSYMVNFSKRNNLIRPPPHLWIQPPGPYYSSVPHASSPCRGIALYPAQAPERGSGTPESTRRHDAHAFGGCDRQRQSAQSIFASENDISKELEKANKAVVKRAASDCLAKHGIHKADANFKEIWGFVSWY